MFCHIWYKTLIGVKKIRSRFEKVEEEFIRVYYGTAMVDILFLDLWIL